MYRRAIEELKSWKESSDRKPLIICGARQTGNEPLHEMIENLDFSMLSVFSTKLTELLRQYCFVGGMPEVVKNFLEDRNFSVAQNIQKQLLAAYEQDFSKHAPYRAVCTAAADILLRH